MRRVPDLGSRSWGRAVGTPVSQRRMREWRPRPQGATPAAGVAAWRSGSGPASHQLLAALGPCASAPGRGCHQSRPGVRRRAAAVLRSVPARHRVSSRTEQRIGPRPAIRPDRRGRTRGPAGTHLAVGDIDRSQRAELGRLRPRRHCRRRSDSGTLRAGLRSQGARLSGYAAASGLAGGRAGRQLRGGMDATVARPHWRDRFDCDRSTTRGDRVLVVLDVALAGRQAGLAGAVPLGARDRHLLARDGGFLPVDVVQHDRLGLQEVRIGWGGIRDHDLADRDRSCDHPRCATRSGMAGASRAPAT